MMNNSLVDFLKTGKIDSIDLDIDIEDLLVRLGVPREFKNIEELRQDILLSKQHARGRFLIEYRVNTGDLEFHFDNDVLVFWVFHSENFDIQYNDLSIDWLENLFSMNLKALNSFANQHGIALDQRIIPAIGTNVVAVRIRESSVQINFADQIGERIYSISRDRSDI